MGNWFRTFCMDLELFLMCGHKNNSEISISKAGTGEKKKEE